jgi:hypothetical protein
MLCSNDSMMSGNVSNNLFMASNPDRPLNYHFPPVPGGFRPLSFIIASPRLTARLAPGWPVPSLSATAVAVILSSLTGKQQSVLRAATWLGYLPGKRISSGSMVKIRAHILIDKIEVSTVGREGMCMLPCLPGSFHHVRHKLAASQDTRITLPMCGAFCGSPAFVAPYEPSPGQVIPSPFCNAILNK